MENKTDKMTAKDAVKVINKNEEKYYENMKKMIANTEQLTIAASPSAPIFGLGTWRREHGLVSPEMNMYIKAVSIKTIMYTIIAFFVGFELAYLHFLGMI